MVALVLQHNDAGQTPGMMQAVYGTNLLEGVLAFCITAHPSMACVGKQPAKQHAMVQHTLVGKLAAVSPVSFQVQELQCLFQAIKLMD